MQVRNQCFDPAGSLRYITHFTAQPFWVVSSSAPTGLSTTHCADWRQRLTAGASPASLAFSVTGGIAPTLLPASSRRVRRLLRIELAGVPEPCMKTARCQCFTGPVQTRRDRDLPQTRCPAQDVREGGCPQSRRFGLRKPAQQARPQTSANRNLVEVIKLMLASFFLAVDSRLQPSLASGQQVPWYTCPTESRAQVDELCRTANP